LVSRDERLTGTAQAGEGGFEEELTLPSGKNAFEALVPTEDTECDVLNARPDIGDNAGDTTPEVEAALVIGGAPPEDGVMQRPGCRGGDRLRV